MWAYHFKAGGMTIFINDEIWTCQWKFEFGKIHVQHCEPDDFPIIKHPSEKNVQILVKVIFWYFKEKHAKIW